VQAAVDAAHDGDTVRIPAGRFAGGVVVTKSINLVGAGPSATALVGGEHVLTIGTWMAPTEPNVRISGLTLRGGRAHSSPESPDFTGLPGAIAGGAGLEIPASDSFLGGTVTVTDSVITDNVSSPVDSVLPGPDQQPGWPHCPDGFCTFAGAFGGGVENWGTLTLVRTTVSDNRAGGALASDADGAGIFSWQNLTLQSSQVTGNHAGAVAPHGRFAEGGGIFMRNVTVLTMRTSSVSGNTASLTSTNPVINPDGSTTDMLANSGGIHVDDGSTVAIDSSRIDDNAAVVDNPQGRAGVINAGLQLTISDLTMTNTSVSGNRAVARIHDVGDFGPMGSALQWCNLGTISGLRANGNATVITSLHGDASGAGAVFAGATLCNGFDPGPSTLSRSLIQNNTTTAIAPHGRADVLGAGINTASSLTMSGVLVSGNHGVAHGSRGGDVQGGGIWNGMFPLPFLDGLHSNLTLTRSLVVGNVVTGGPGEATTGGGIYTRDPIALSLTAVVGNRPDQCTGCSSAAVVARAGGVVGTGVIASARRTTDPLLARLFGLAR
jgi:hypothetical protein